MSGKESILSSDEIVILKEFCKKVATQRQAVRDYETRSNKRTFVACVASVPMAIMLAVVVLTKIYYDYNGSWPEWSWFGLLFLVRAAIFSLVIFALFVATFFLIDGGLAPPPALV
jgi:sterol desaturase/sphingolipid hydroxylase (fatty acid hydroxylase superfamily)